MYLFSRITTSEIEFMRAMRGYTRWDHKRNNVIVKKLHLQPILQFIDNYQLQWKKKTRNNEWIDTENSKNKASTPIDYRVSKKNKNKIKDGLNLVVWGHLVIFEGGCEEYISCCAKVFVLCNKLDMDGC